MLPRKFHLSFGRVYVDVHRRNRQRHFQHTAGEAAFQKLIPIALFQRRRQHLGLDEPAVDEEHLHGAGTSAVHRGRHKATHGDVAAPAVHRHQRSGKFPAQRGIDGGFQLSIAGGMEGFLPILDEFEGNVRVAQGQMLHQPRHGGRLGAVLFHKFQSGGGVIEEVCHPDGGSLRRALLPDRLHMSALAVEGRAHGVLRAAGQHVHPADGGNGRQSFPPEAQCADSGKILRRAELAGSMAQKRGGQLLRRDTAAVVRHPDQAHAAPLDLHHNGGGTGVNGVFHQLLDHGSRALDHLAGGDEIGDMRG